MTSWYDTTKNVAGKSRTKSNPYATITHPYTGWKWSILKSWQADNSKTHARWFCYVEGDYSELGDEYCYNVRGALRLALASSEPELYVQFDESVFNTLGEFCAWAWGER